MNKITSKEDIRNSNNSIKNKEQSLVSVFLPYYNDQKFLKNSIESVLNQTYQNWELILCNHASTDDSRKIAHSYSDGRIKHIDMPKNYGAGGGLVFKTMLDAANGKYVKTLCADDCLCPNCLEKMVAFIEKHSQLDFAFCDILYIDEKGESLNDSWFKARPDFSLENGPIELLKLYRKGIQTLPYIGAIARREALLNIHYDPSIIMLFDMSIWLQLLLQGKKMTYLPEILAEYRCHSEQMSGTNSKGINIILRRSYFERPVFHEYFAECEDTYLIKKVFSDDKYANKLWDKKDIPFIVYHGYFTDSEELFHCYKLHELLKDETYRQHLIKEFGYDVDIYRKEYSYPLLKNPKKDEKISGLKKFKMDIFITPSKKLHLPQLLFLTGRRLFQILTIFSLRKKKKKEYSL